MATGAAFKELGSLYPKERLLTNPAQLAAYESDGLTAFRTRPVAVVLPETQGEVVETVRLCHQHEVPFMARGSGTSLSGGSTPVKDGIVIALNRLNRIVELDPDERICVVESGVINIEVSRAAAAHGLYYAPDPSSQPICTIGGNIAFNSGGAHCLKYGMTANHVLGLKAVLPDGEVFTTGGRSLEFVGPDLTGFYCGHEGLFGITLEATLRLLPLPESFKTVMAAYSSLEQAGRAVADVISLGLLPGAMEIMDRLALKAAQAGVKAEYPEGAEAVLIVELDGEKDAVEAEFERLKEVIQASGANQVSVARNADERALIWKGRKSSFSAVGRLAPDFIVQDGVVPRGKLGEALAEIERLSARYGIGVANVFHAGDGNLHPLILYDGREEGALERAEALAGEILKLCVRLGGSITGEHGVGMEKRDYLPYMFSDVDLNAMREVRASIDAKGLSNPGKVFSDPARVGDEPVASHAEPASSGD